MYTYTKIYLIIYILLSMMVTLKENIPSMFFLS